MGRFDERIVQLNFDGYGLIDLSIGGAAFFGSRDVNLGVDVVVVFETIEIKSSVVYCNVLDNGFRVGVKFYSIDSKTQAALEIIVDNFSKGVPCSCKLRQTTEAFK